MISLLFSTPFVFVHICCSETFVYLFFCSPIIDLSMKTGRTSQRPSQRSSSRSTARSGAKSTRRLGTQSSVPNLDLQSLDGAPRRRPKTGKPVASLSAKSKGGNSVTECVGSAHCICENCTCGVHHCPETAIREVHYEADMTTTMKSTFIPKGNAKRRMMRPKQLPPYKAEGHFE